MSAFGLPVLVSAGPQGDTRTLRRIPIASAETGAFDEQWLQQTLFNHPECIPLDELEAGTGPLIPLCMELSTPAGFADIVYLTPAGRIVLVETKLFRNPDARRLVIAQIIDYAKELSDWKYEDLARQVAIATRQPAGHLLELARAKIPNFDEARFIDGVTRSLKTADMLLLIMGDGIRSNLESLVAFFDRHAMLRYRLALLEVGVFRLSSDELIVQPRILAKTQVIERRVLIDAGKIVDVTDETGGASTSEKEARRAWYLAFWKEFCKQLVLDDASQPLPNPSRTHNVSLPMPPSSEVWVTAYVAQAAGHAGVFLSFGNSCEDAPEIYSALFAQRAEIEQILGEAVEWRGPDVGEGIVFKTKIDNLKEPGERARVLAILARMSNRFVNAFRSRLATIARAT